MVLVRRPMRSHPTPTSAASSGPGPLVPGRADNIGRIIGILLVGTIALGCVVYYLALSASA
jgi:hypothetical protein